MLRLSWSWQVREDMMHGVHLYNSTVRFMTLVIYLIIEHMEDQVEMEVSRHDIYRVQLSGSNRF